MGSDEIYYITTMYELLHYEQQYIDGMLEALCEYYDIWRPKNMYTVAVI